MKPTTFRALLYSIPVFGAAWVDEIVPVLRNGEWPTPQSCVGTFIVSLVATAITLRAYYDGSHERSKNNGNTTIIPKA